MTSARIRMSLTDSQTRKARSTSASSLRNVASCMWSAPRRGLSVIVSCRRRYKAAVVAVKRWKYRPKVVNGEVTIQKGVQTAIKFAIEKKR